MCAEASISMNIDRHKAHVPNGWQRMFKEHDMKILSRVMCVCGFFKVFGSSGLRVFMLRVRGISDLVFVRARTTTYACEMGDGRDRQVYWTIVCNFELIQIHSIKMIFNKKYNNACRLMGRYDHFGI